MTPLQAQDLRRAQIRADFDDDIPARFADLRNGGNLPPEPARMGGIWLVLIAWIAVAAFAAVVLG